MIKSVRRKTTTVLASGIVLTCLWQPAAHGQGSRPDDASGRDAGRTAATSLRPGANDFIEQAAEINQAQTVMAQLALQQASTDAVKTYARRMLEAHAQATTELESLRASTSPGGASRPADAQTPEKGRTEPNPAASSGNTATENVDARTDTTGSESGLGVAASPAVGSRMGRTDPTGDPAPGMSSEAYKDHGQLSEKHQVSINRMKGLSGPAYDKEYMAVQVKNHQDAIRLYEGQLKNGDNARLAQHARQHLPVLREHLQAATRIQKSLSGSR